MTLASGVTLLIGLAVLLFGRQLFWLFVGATGFALGLHLAPLFLGRQPEWLIVVAALALGVLGALVAVLLEVVAIGLGGFLAGAYAAFSLLRILDVNPSGLGWLAVLLGGAVGAVVVLMLLDWALIVLSSITGAALLVQLTRYTPPVTAALFLVLLIVGLSFQAYQLPGTRTGATRADRK